MSTIVYKTLTIIILLISVTISSQYDPTISKMLQQYSIINHCTYQQIVNWQCQLCKKLEKLEKLNYVYSDITDIAVYGGFHKGLDKIVLFFRGTVDIKNWVEDFSYQQLPYKYCSKCKIHAGFYLAFQSISINFAFVTTSLVNSYQDKQILVVGSSLGGALATVAAIDLKLRFTRKVIQLHTFGSPRVGNDNLAMFIKTRVPCFRVVHNHDIVPHLPLQSQNYHHISKQVLFDQPMINYKICNDQGEDDTCSNAYYPNYSINDHITYWQKLDVHEICG